MAEDLVQGFGKWRQGKQATDEAINRGEAYTPPAEESGNFIGNVFRDVKNKLSQWWTGAEQGAGEIGRAAEQMPVSMSSAEVPGGAGLTEQDQAAIDYNRQAISKFTQETVKPVAYTLGLIQPTLAAPFLVGDVVGMTEEEVKKGNIYAPNLVGSVAAQLLGVDAIKQAATDPQKFFAKAYEEPVTTATEFLPAFLVGRGIVKGMRTSEAAKPVEVATEAKAEARPVEVAEVKPQEVVADFGKWREEQQGELGKVEAKLQAEIDATIEPVTPDAGMSIRKTTLQPEAEPSPLTTFSDPAIEARWQEASKGVQVDSLTTKIRDAWDTFKAKATRTYEDLPNAPEFAQAKNDLLFLEKQKGVAGDKTLRLLQGITIQLDKPGMDLFTRKLILDDLAKTEGAMPFGFTPETLAKEKATIDAAVSPAVKEALTKRREVQEAVKKDYIKAMDDIGFDVAERLSREDYFRHQVLEYANLRSVAGTGEQLRTPTQRDFLKKREGSEKDINANYLQAEFEVTAQMLYDIEVARTIKKMDVNYNIRGKLMEQFGDQWRDNIPEGYTTWQPREGTSFYMASAIPERVASQLLEGTMQEIGIGAEQIRQVLAKGAPFKELVVKQEIADTLNQLGTPPTHNAISKVNRPLISAWKQWVLMGPTRIIKYTLRNITGDADALFAMNKSAFREIPKATNELYQTMYGDRSMTPEMGEWFRRGGMESTLVVQELPDVNSLRMFNKFADSEPGMVKKAWIGYWEKARTATQFREAIMRYAAYKDYLKQMQENGGKPRNFGASVPEEVMAIADIRDRAFKLSNEVMGAYDSVSVLGKDIRNNLIPFWSWYETNAGRYAQFFKNQAAGGMPALGQSVAEKLIGHVLIRSPYYAYQLGSFTLKAGAVWGMLQVYNNTVWPEEETELPEDERARPHIILGRDADGKVRYFNRLGAFGDFLEWFGLDTPAKDAQDFLDGTRSMKEIAMDMAQSPVNKIAQGVTPTIKIPGELATGRRLFPNVFNAMPIRDNGQYIADSLGLGNEFKAISKTDAAQAVGVNPRPSKPYLSDNTAENLLYYKAEPGKAAYDTIREEKARYLQSIGKGGDGSFVSPKSEALRNYKVALRLKDADTAAFYLAEYKRLGGTKTGLRRSLESLDPLAGMSNGDKKKFKQSLTNEQLRELEKATVYYKAVLSGKD